jgi:hypothetical protein
VKKCLCGDLVQGRTVLLVTHNIALTAPIAEFVVSFGNGGRLVATGSPKDTLLKDEALVVQIEHEQEAIEFEDDLEGDDDTRDAGEPGADKSKKLMLEEEVQTGRVTWKAMSLFLGAFSGWPLLFWTGYLSGQRWALDSLRPCVFRADIPAAWLKRAIYSRFGGWAIGLPPTANQATSTSHSELLSSPTPHGLAKHLPATLESTLPSYLEYSSCTASTRHYLLLRPCVRVGLYTAVCWRRYFQALSGKPLICKERPLSLHCPKFDFTFAPTHEYFRC